MSTLTLAEAVEELRRITERLERIAAEQDERDEHDARTHDT